MSMLSALAVTWLALGPATPPDHYNAKWLCDLWAGAQCHATTCLPDGAERCLAARKHCMSYTRDMKVGEEKSKRVAECSKAMLQSKCGELLPPACEGVEKP